MMLSWPKGSSSTSTVSSLFLLSRAAFSLIGLFATYPSRLLPDARASERAQLRGDKVQQGATAPYRKGMYEYT